MCMRDVSAFPCATKVGCTRVDTNSRIVLFHILLIFTILKVILQRVILALPNTVIFFRDPVLFPKYALEKVNGWRAGGVGGSWRRPPPIEDSQDVGQTVLGRKYHAQNPSGLGVTHSGVKGSFSPNTHLKKSTGGGPVELVVASVGPHPLKTTKILARQSWAESITRKFVALHPRGWGGLVSQKPHS